MKKLNVILLFSLISLIIFCSNVSSSIFRIEPNCKVEDKSQLKDGDIIFHTSQSSQSKMLQLATSSELTHVGVIFINNGKPYVFEAVQPVKITSFDSFVSRGLNSNYKILRPKTPLTKDQIKKGMAYSKLQMGKNYDLKFQWGDKKMYCSELVWKIYKHMGVELCEPKTFANFNLDDPIVRLAIKKRYGNQKFDLNELVVAPSDIYESDLLTTIYNTY